MQLLLSQLLCVALHAAAGALSALRRLCLALRSLQAALLGLGFTKLRSPSALGLLVLCNTPCCLKTQLLRAGSALLPELALLLHLFAILLLPCSFLTQACFDS